MERIIYAADVVYNGVGLPLENAGVAISKVGQDATIIGFGRLEVLQTTFPETRVQRLGRVILPRPVNAHTHLDLSHVPFKALPYPRWIPEHIVAHANSRGLAAAKDGLAALISSGVAAFGDIVAKEEVMDYLLNQSSLKGVAYWEVIEANPDKADEVMTATLERVRRWRKLNGHAVRLGLSPHTPFTVSSKLLQRLAEFARLEGLPMQIHVAEHPSEVELFQTGNGALAKTLRAFHVPPFETSWGRQPSAILSPIKYLAELRVLEAKPTLIHAVNVSEEDVRIIAQYGCSVVTCPRSNHNLECGNIPWKLFAKHGVELAIGTDSCASGQSLDLREEASAAMRLLDIDLKHIVRWAVKGGYRALGLKPPVVQRGDSFSNLTVWE